MNTHFFNEVNVSIVFTPVLTPWSWVCTYRVSRSWAEGPAWDCSSADTATRGAAGLAGAADTQLANTSGANSEPHS